MAEELDVSWFDLSKYDALDELDLSEWHTQLEVRNVIANIVSEYGNDDEEFELLSEIRKLQQNPIWRFYDGRLGLEWTACPNLSAYPFNSYSVYSTPALHVWCNRTGVDESLQDVWDRCEEYDGYINPVRDAPIYAPYDFLLQQNGFDYENETNVTIDLTATDEQILSDFQHWLTEYRKATGYQSNKTNFTDKDLADWRKYQVLPYIDLTLSRDIEGKRMTQTKIASLIFNGIDDPVGALRTTKKKAEWLLKCETLATIEAQLSSFKGSKN